MIVVDSAPVSVPAVCELRVGLEDATAPCMVSAGRNGDMTYVSFRVGSDTFYLGGETASDGVRVVAFIMTGMSQAVRITGYCVHNADTRRIACSWFMGSEDRFSLVAQY